MERIRLITRTDDAGCCPSANAAIAAGLKAGSVRNVSVMAVGPCIEDAATLVADAPDVCFGLHATLNAEWDEVKWGPLTPLETGSGLVDANGYFLPRPELFRPGPQTVAAALLELDAQLARLLELGFPIRYVDTHMYIEAGIPGIRSALQGWAAGKGLLFHTDIVPMETQVRYPYEPQDDEDRWLCELAARPAGTYVMVAHPAFDSPETRRFINSRNPGGRTAQKRDAEARVLADPTLTERMAALGICPIRYDEAGIR